MGYFSQYTETKKTDTSIRLILCCKLFYFFFNCIYVSGWGFMFLSAVPARARSGLGRYRQVWAARGRKKLVSLSETLNSVWDKNVYTLEFYLPSWKSGSLVKCLHGVYRTVGSIPHTGNIYPPNMVFPKTNLPLLCFKRIPSVLLFIPQVKQSSACIANPTKAWWSFCPNTYRFVSKSFWFPLEDSTIV